MKLFFLDGNVTQVMGVVFAVSLTSDRTNFYEKFTAFLGQLFTSDQIKRNAILLLTKGDLLKPQAVQENLESIRKEVARLKETDQWNLEIVQWSNKEPLPDQEKNLFNVASSLPGFSTKEALETMEKEIDAQAKKAFEASENQTKSIVSIKDWKAIEQLQFSHASEAKCVTFKGNNMSEPNRPVIKASSSILSSIKAQANQVKKRISKGGVVRIWSCTKTLRFNGPVQSVELSVTTDDALHHKNRLEHSINGGEVTVTAHFSHSVTNPIQNYDVNIKVEAIILITTPVKQMVEYETGQPMVIHHRTLAEIRESILRKRIEELS